MLHSLDRGWSFFNQHSFSLSGLRTARPLMQMREYRHIHSTPSMTALQKKLSPKHLCSMMAGGSSRFSLPITFLVASSLISDPNGRTIIAFALHAKSLLRFRACAAMVVVGMHLRHRWLRPCCDTVAICHSHVVIAFVWGFNLRLDLICAGRRARRPRRGKWWLSSCPI
jgi:hypothetical protein